MNPLLVQLFRSYHFAFLFWWSLILGSMMFLLIIQLVGGRWGRVIYRPLLAASRTAWLLPILFLPVALGARAIFPWTDPVFVAAHPAVAHKASYLNLTFFYVRAVIYFAIWIFLPLRVERWSQQSRYYEDPVYRRKMQRFSAIGIILLSLTVSFASIDWMMSLEPDWFSTIYGLMIIAAQALAGLAFGIFVRSQMTPLEVDRTSRISTPDLNRDLGALLLTSVMMWAYIAFSQLLIIWSGNIPREATWYLVRSMPGWMEIGILVYAFQFFLPFLVLLSLRAKRSARVLMFLSAAILLVHLLDTYWLVMPAFFPQGLMVSSLDLVALGVVVVIGGFVFRSQLGRTPEPILPAVAASLEGVPNRGPVHTPRGGAE